MKVLHVPTASTNPYQQQLTDALEDRGMTIRLADADGRFPLFSAIRTSGKPDIVHLHWLHPFFLHRSILTTMVWATLFVFELVYLRLLGITLVWTVHNHLSHEGDAPTIDRLVRHIVCRLSDRIIVHCPSAAAVIQQCYRLPSRYSRSPAVIPHGHFVDWYANDISPIDARQMLDLPADAHVFLYFGSIRPYKNVPGLLTAFAEIDDDAAYLVIAGNPWNEHIEQRIRERCAADDRIRTSMEFIPDDEVQQYLNAADVVVLPFDEIFTSGTVTLAASFGKPVIAPDVGCVGAQVGTQDLLFDPEESNGLRQMMEQSLAADLDDLGQSNLDWVHQFNWDNIADQTAEVYGHAARSPSSV